MKILVAVKRVPDYKATIRLKSDGTGVETQNVKMTMNPFDEIALEEAIRIKEKGHASEIIAVSIGTMTAGETLRTALAMGADRAILINTEMEVQPLQAAKLLKSIVEKEKPQLVILGKQAIDTDNNQVGQMLAALLNWPQATFASKIEFRDDGVSVTREIDGGLETLRLQLPAVVTTDLRLNEPRYISLPNIVQAKRKPLVTMTVDELDIVMTSKQKTLQVSIPEKRRAGKRLENVTQLVQCLKNEVKVLS